MKNVMISMEELAPLIQLQLQQGGRATLTVTGNSMQPMLCHRRDAVSLQPVEQKIKKGELILYRREDGAYILHRVVGCTAQDQYICSGDNQWEKEAVSHQQVIARVYEFRRKSKVYPITCRGYRFYVWLWVWMFPVRRPILAARRLMGRICRVINK